VPLVELPGGSEAGDVLLEGGGTVKMPNPAALDHGVSVDGLDHANPEDPFGGFWAGEPLIERIKREGPANYNDVVQQFHQPEVVLGLHKLSRFFETAQCPGVDLQVFKRVAPFCIRWDYNQRWKDV